MALVVYQPPPLCVAYYPAELDHVPAGTVKQKKKGHRAQNLLVTTSVVSNASEDDIGAPAPVEYRSFLKRFTTTSRLSSDWKKNMPKAVDSSRSGSSAFLYAKEKENFPYWEVPRTEDSFMLSLGKSSSSDSFFVSAPVSYFGDSSSSISEPALCFSKLSNGWVTLLPYLANAHFGPLHCIFTPISTEKTTGKDLGDVEWDPSRVGPKHRTPSKENAMGVQHLGKPVSTPSGNGMSPSLLEGRLPRIFVCVEKNSYEAHWSSAPMTEEQYQDDQENERRERMRDRGDQKGTESHSSTNLPAIPSSWLQKEDWPLISVPTKDTKKKSSIRGVSMIGWTSMSKRSGTSRRSELDDDNDDEKSKGSSAFYSSTLRRHGFILFQRPNSEGKPIARQLQVPEPIDWDTVIPKALKEGAPTKGAIEIFPYEAVGVASAPLKPVHHSAAPKKPSWSFGASTASRDRAATGTQDSYEFGITAPKLFSAASRSGSVASRLRGGGGAALSPGLPKGSQGDATKPSELWSALQGNASTQGRAGGAHGKFFRSGSVHSTASRTSISIQEGRTLRKSGNSSNIHKSEGDLSCFQKNKSSKRTSVTVTHRDRTRGLPVEEPVPILAVSKDVYSNLSAGAQTENMYFQKTCVKAAESLEGREPVCAKSTLSVDSDPYFGKRLSRPPPSLQPGQSSEAYHGSSPYLDSDAEETRQGKKKTEPCGYPKGKQKEWSTIAHPTQDSTTRSATSIPVKTGSERVRDDSYPRFNNSVPSSDSSTSGCC